MGDFVDIRAVIGVAEVIYKLNRQLSLLDWYQMNKPFDTRMESRASFDEKVQVRIMLM